jgi:hypothetical protein
MATPKANSRFEGTLSPSRGVVVAMQLRDERISRWKRFWSKLRGSTILMVIRVFILVVVAIWLLYTLGALLYPPSNQNCGARTRVGMSEFPAGSVSGQNSASVDGRMKPYRL